MEMWVILLVAGGVFLAIAYAWRSLSAPLRLLLGAIGIVLMLLAWRFHDDGQEQAASYPSYSLGPAADAAPPGSNPFAGPDAQLDAQVASATGDASSASARPADTAESGYARQEPVAAESPAWMRSSAAASEPSNTAPAKACVKPVSCDDPDAVPVKPERAAARSAPASPAARPSTRKTTSPPRPAPRPAPEVQLAPAVPPDASWQASLRDPCKRDRRIADGGVCVVLRDALGYGQQVERLQVFIEGRPVGAFELNGMNPSEDLPIRFTHAGRFGYRLIGEIRYPDRRVQINSQGVLVARDGYVYDLRLAPGEDRVFVELAPAGW